jgi:cellulose synthase/poly-beta-1,6-N-acetylglucosamine synthase-like glycosyltransferase
VSAFRGASWCIGVIVPARDEADTIGPCIGSILAAAACADVGALWIVIVADSCTDGTADLAREALAGRGEVLECHAGSAGAARRLGVSAALQHFAGVVRERLWLANTDADSMVTRDWLEVHLQLADQGMAGVAGIVHLDQDSDDLARRVHDATYRTNADGTHDHVHGANMAVRADAYLDVGGWSGVAVGEDHCLWGRLRRCGWPLSSPAHSVVMTSSRRDGRAEGGFATTLKRKIEAQCVTP